MKFSITTFGCQMNMHDSEKITGILMEEGYSLTEDPKEADLIIFNTCSIRQKAEQKFLSELGRIKVIKKQNPNLRVAVAGCIAQQMGEGIFKRASHVDYVIGTQNIHRIKDILKTKGHAAALQDNLAEIELPALRKQKGRAWVSIMYGCNNFCSYCVVPYTRGREISRSTENILKEITGLVGSGVKEVTLLGQNVNSFKSSTDFTGLLEKINNIDGIERIRFVTSHPKDFSDALIDAMKRLNKVCEHIHLPIQTGSTKILRLMNRGYSYDEYKRKVDTLRNKIPEIAITSDIIAGFPEETEADHKDTLAALREIAFDGIFAFKFSPRSGTAASAMEGQVPDNIKAERLSEIFRVQDEITLLKNKQREGKTEEVMVEGISETNPNTLTGKTRTNKIVNWGCESLREGVIDHQNIIGKLIKVKILKAKKHSLEGEIKT